MDAKSAALGTAACAAAAYLLLRSTSSDASLPASISADASMSEASSFRLEAPSAATAALDSATGATELSPSNRLLRKAETVIQRRTDRLLLVVERSTSSHNYSALLRTAEALGIQHVWCVAPPGFDADEVKRSQKKKKNQWVEEAEELRQHVAFAKQANKWLTLRDFATTTELVAALRMDGRQIWCTDLSQHAESLGDDNPAAAAATSAGRASSFLPQKLAICFGTELAGASVELLAAADKRVYLPLHGYADSLNLSVAGALVMARLLALAPEMVGGMAEAGRAELRARFYPAMGRKDEQRAYFAAAAEQVNAGELEVLPFGDLRRPDEHRKHQGANTLDPAGREGQADSGLNKSPGQGRKAGRLQDQQERAAAKARRAAAAELAEA